MAIIQEYLTTEISEKEWRLIDSTQRDYFDDKASAIPYKPVAIYYGRHMALENKRELHTIAKEKVIKEYEMDVDYSSGEFELGCRRVGG